VAVIRVRVEHLLEDGTRPRLLHEVLIRDTGTGDAVHRDVDIRATQRGKVFADPGNPTPAETGKTAWRGGVRADQHPLAIVRTCLEALRLHPWRP
jgi:hypothetical protein